MTDPAEQSRSVSPLQELGLDSSPVRPEEKSDMDPSPGNSGEIGAEFEQRNSSISGHDSVDDQYIALADEIHSVLSWVLELGRVVHSAEYLERLLFKALGEARAKRMGPALEAIHRAQDLHDSVRFRSGGALAGLMVLPLVVSWAGLGWVEWSYSQSGSSLPLFQWWTHDAAAPFPPWVFSVAVVATVLLGIFPQLVFGGVVRRSSRDLHRRLFALSLSTRMLKGRIEEEEGEEVTPLERVVSKLDALLRNPLDASLGKTLELASERASLLANQADRFDETFSRLVQDLGAWQQTLLGFKDELVGLQKTHGEISLHAESAAAAAKEIVGAAQPLTNMQNTVASLGVVSSELQTTFERVFSAANEELARITVADETVKQNAEASSQVLVEANSLATHLNQHQQALAKQLADIAAYQEKLTIAVAIADDFAALVREMRDPGKDSQS